jgi:hypothetical protein
MADIIDDAQAYNELHQEVSLKNQLVHAQPETHPGFDGWHCVDCEDEIPAKKLGLGRVRCMDCQGHKDRVDAAARRNGRPEEA